jgi:mono/diheme cytochrome c family protein
MASAFRTVLSTVVICTLLLATSRFSAAQAKQAQSADVANPKSGALIFRQDCAVCHGEDAKGHGPASVALNVRPANLTTLAQRHGGKFPDDYVLSVLRNGVKAPAHGTAEMPIWGPVFDLMNRNNETQSKLRITNLTSYLKSIQTR